MSAAIDKVHARAEGVSKADVKIVLDALSAEVAELASGAKLRFPGFGTFAAVTRPEREGRNPRTGETVHVPAKRVVKFKA